MSDLIPFNLERALAGDPVVTRDGRSVTQLHKFVTTKDVRISGVLGAQVISWDECGCYWNNTVVNESDLYMAPPPKKKIRGWVNVYRIGISINFETDYVYSTKGKADERARRERIACIEIDVEEGHGL